MNTDTGLERERVASDVPGVTSLCKPSVRLKREREREREREK